MDLLLYEKAAVKEGYNVICGIDEAGRGPLAGPVYAAAVILPTGLIIDGVDDSKKLTEKKRNYLFDKIIDECIAYAVGSASEREIDDLNILNATFLAMSRAVDSLKIKPDIALVDGNGTPDLHGIEVKTIIKGDSKSESVAAASIIAKVSRDRYMMKMNEIYPEYHFDQHKGYGTKLHYEMIKQYGPCSIHRKTFLKSFLNK